MGIESTVRATTVEVREAATGALVASARSPHPPVDGVRREQDPTVWWAALLDAVARTGVDDVGAVSVAGQTQCLVLADEAGAVLRPAKVWSDTEAAPHARRLVRSIGAARWAAAIGHVPDAATPIAKLAWVAEHEPRVLARVGRLLTPHDWLTFRLTGRMVTDRGEASTTGWWATGQERWRPDVLRQAIGQRSEQEWADCLPPVLAPGERADWMAALTHEQVGLRGRPLVAAGTGHAMATALGIGLASRETAIGLGAFGSVTTVAEAAVGDESGTVAGLADATGRFLPLVRTGDAMAAVDAVLRLLAIDRTGFEALMAAEAPGAGGLVLRPGRAAGRPRAGAFHGFDGDCTRGQMARAVAEGVVCAALAGVDSILDAGARLTDSPIRLHGTGARSMAMRQLVADLSGRPVVASDGTAARGACVQAAAVLAEARPEDIVRAWRLRAGPITEPDPDLDPEPIRAQWAAAGA